MPIEKTVTCPRNPKWLKSMLELLPPGLRGKLAPFEECLSPPASSVPSNLSAGQQRRRGVIHPRIL